MVDEMNGMDFGLWTKQKWSSCKICNNINTTEVEYTNTNKVVEQDGYT